MPPWVVTSVGGPLSATTLDALKSKILAFATPIKHFVV